MADSDKRALLEPQAEMLLADDRVAAWILVWQHRGLTHCLDQMSTFYSHLGLVAALASTICAAAVMSPPEGIEELFWAQSIYGVAGMIGFCVAFWTIISCVI